MKLRYYLGTFLTILAIYMVYSYNKEWDKLEETRAEFYRIIEQANEKGI